MNSQTAQLLVEHSKSCNTNKYTKGTVQRSKNDDRYIEYQCIACKFSIKESLEIVEPATKKCA